MTLAERAQVYFWPRVEKVPRGCWEWSASCDDKGYGTFWDGSKVRKTNRVVWELVFGEIPRGSCVCHHCDNPRCVRPDHLFLGTRRDNVRDMVAKGRAFSQRKTHCPQGHVHSERDSRGYRICRECRRTQTREQKRRTAVRLTYEAFCASRRRGAETLRRKQAAQLAERMASANLISL